VKSDGSDNINACHRSNSKELVATTDEMGSIKIFNYPCLEKGAKFVQGQGHSSHVTNVRFNKVDSNLVTVGGNDRSVFVWTVKNLK